MIKKKQLFLYPMIWYKGYRAEYSKGCRGSQPVLKQRALPNQN